MSKSKLCETIVYSQVSVLTYHILPYFLKILIKKNFHTLASDFPNLLTQALLAYVTVGLITVSYFFSFVFQKTFLDLRIFDSSATLLFPFDHLASVSCSLLQFSVILTPTNTKLCTVLYEFQFLSLCFVTPT